MSSESVHGKLERVRPPRVHIKYKLLASEPERELPFVMGVMADLAGNDAQGNIKPLRDRSFVQIDRDNFNDVMKRMTPGLNFRVENTLEGDGSELAVNLKFQSMEDFHPARVAGQIEPLRKLLETRDKLNEALAKVDLSPEYEALLQQLLENENNLKDVAGKVGSGGSEDASSSDASEEGDSE